MTQKEQTEIDNAHVESVLVKRILTYYNVRIKIGEEKYITPICIDSDEEKTFYNLDTLPQFSEEGLQNLFEKIDEAIDEVPSLEKSKHIRGDKNLEEEFYKDCKMPPKEKDISFSENSEEKEKGEIEKIRNIIRGLPKDRQIFYAEFMKRDKFPSKVWDNLLEMLKDDLMRIW
jgi:hypothetical protein